MRWMLIAVALATVASSPVRGQKGADPRSVTPEKLVTVIGTIEAVRERGLEGCLLCEACSDCQATHVLLQTRKGEVEVHLAPASYLARLEFAPSPGDEIRVIGTRMRMAKARGLAAHEVHAGPIGIRLRDEHGLPLWRRLLTDAREPARNATAK